MELTGAIPVAFAMLKRLQVMYLAANRITGSIPVELGQMTSLNLLQLRNNLLSGSIPDSFGNISTMQHLILANNTLSAGIPRSLGRLEGLIELDLSVNALNGSLPPELGNLKVLTELHLPMNQLSGNISSDLGKLQMLTRLDLSKNSFDGQIPQSLGQLLSIISLNLSYNFLTGGIPNSLANLRYVNSLDLSFNKLEGMIPKGRVFSNSSIPSLIGNEALCGAPQLKFSPCNSSIPTSISGGSVHSLKYILPVIASSTLILACLYIACNRKRRGATLTQTAMPNSENQTRVVSYQELVRATNKFSQDNLLGTGNFGSVFKGCLDDGLIVAVKVLNLQVEGALESFDAECQVLRRVRHRNLIKIISACCNLEFKALVLKFMPNGSLEQWLYSDDKCLNLLQRLNIMVDVSLALEHLHHHHTHVVLHCDLKPSNVLLDEDMVAHVSDFGIAKLLLGDSWSMASASTPGTLGYIAPEYAFTGKVSKMGDVYGFGILLLETVTRKKPTDAMFGGESSMRQWICNGHHNAILSDIVDRNLLNDGSTPQDLIATHRCLSSVIELGLLCSSDSARERIPMTEVATRLQKIKLEYLS